MIRVVKLVHTSVDALDGRRRSVAVAVCLEPNFNTYKELRNRNNPKRGRAMKPSLLSPSDD